MLSIYIHICILFGMKMQPKYMISLLIAITIAVFFKGYLMEVEELENIHIFPHLGNYLSKYFHNLGRSLLEQKDFAWEIPNVNFIKDLPSRVGFNESTLVKQTYECFKKNNITLENSTFDKYNDAAWHVINNTQMQFWNCMRPLINQILDDAFTKSEIPKNKSGILFHLRCADVPFGKHFHYHFDKYDFYKKALENIKNNGIHDKNVRLLFNTSHLSENENQQSCNIYIGSLIKYLENLGYSVTIVSKSNIEDFADMFYADAVISSVSSFAFMSAFFGNGVYYSSEHIEEGESTTQCTLCKSWTLPSTKLRHRDVADYHDTENVISLLKQSTG